MKSLTQRLKRLKDDERGVSPVVGFVLIFALIMIVFTLYQSSVVPAQNKEVEFKHSQTVEGQMSQLNDAMRDAGAGGAPQSVTVSTGVQYPDRALAINPGSPAGSLSTGSKRTVKLSGLSTTEGKYWDGGTKRLDTQLLTYQASYNLYQNEPRIVFENGMTVKNFDSGTSIVQNNENLLSEDGSQINLLLINGKYQFSGSVASVTATPVSSSTEYHNLKSNSGTITIPTTLPADKWEEILDGDPSDSSDSGKQFASFGGYNSHDPNTNTVTINLDSTRETYELRLTKISLNNDGDQSEHYLTSASPTTQTLSLGESATFTVTARDKLGNPVPGADVTATVDAANSGGTGTFDSSPTKTTNENGRATFSFRPDTVTAKPIKVDVMLDSGGGGTDLSKVTYTVDADTRQGFIDNGYGIDVTIDSVDLNGDQLEIVFENTRGKQVTATTMQLNGFLSKKNKPVTSATLEGTSISFNEGPVALGSDEFTVPAGGSKTVTLDLDDSPNGVGLLIADVTFESASGQTLTATYATSVDNT